MALVDIASQNRFIEGKECKAVTLADIAERQNITVAYLEQIFCKLKNSGLVKSQRGPGGGYALNKPCSEIHIADIINAVEEKIKMTRCGSEAPACMGEKGKCATHDLWEGLSQHIENYFESISLNDVVNNKICKTNFEQRATIN